MADMNLYINAVAEVATDSGDGLTFNLHGFEAQVSPVPVVYVNGVLESAANYTFNYGSSSVRASITFSGSQTGNAITCDYSWKYTGTASTDVTVYEVERTYNVNAIVDVNGRDMIVESYSKVGNYRLSLVWEFMDQDFFDEIWAIVEGDAYTFDIERPSLASPLDRINNLYPVQYPQYSEIAGVPGASRLSLEVMQVTAV